MKRFVQFLLLGLALTADARGSGRAEAGQALEKFLALGMPLNQFVNRVEYLGEQGWVSDELVTALRQAPDPRRRGQLLEALAAIAPTGHDDAEKVLLSAVRGDELGVRLSSVRALGRLKSTHAVPVLLTLLGDASIALRRDAAKALGDIGNGSASAALATALKTEGEVEARVAMLLALGRLHDAKQAAVIEPFLSSDSESTRLAAAQALCLVGSPKGLAVAKRLLASAVASERLMGASVLDGAPAAIARPALRASLTDPDHHVRALAARVLLQGGDRSKLDWLVLASEAAQGDHKLAYEEQLERLHVSDEERRAIIKKAQAHP
jgi:HEAT repeat protein